ncbi:alpha/beta hydrolase [Neiella marina]|uniref:Alpha/beta hydrolase n=1 Tax=Neiella holothuriorum TaxID=2870530 RepID=A0ABS7EIW6_9GAMM|nr:alpha/beta hydrolase [Neiella holothuriorum]MBW8192265.1 alpha/beta hydrolase [Neiella holothuriorum]
MTPLIQHSPHGIPLVLSPANGFPPLVYRALLDELTSLNQLQLWLAEHRPLWRNQQLMQPFNWQQLATDLIQQIEQQQLPPVILLGHSLGAVLGLMAARRRPDLFRQLILVDPVFFPAYKSHFLRWLPWRFKRTIPMIKKTLGRPERFADAHSAFKFHRRASAFRNLSDEGLQTYIEHGFEEVDSELQLRFGKSWEAAIYGSLPNVWPDLRQLETPTIAIRAQHSNTLALPQWQRWQRLKPQHQFVEFSGSEHLLPLTEPHRLADYLRPVLSQLVTAASA